MAKVFSAQPKSKMEIVSATTEGNKLYFYAQGSVLLLLPLVKSEKHPPHLSLMLKVSRPLQVPAKLTKRSANKKSRTIEDMLLSPRASRSPKRLLLTMVQLKRSTMAKLKGGHD